MCVRACGSGGCDGLGEGALCIYEEGNEEEKRMKEG